ncbi:MAG: LysM peptidoglycan-binding domain-containing protein [Acidobacteriota bacterium]|nr:LysM peptidoglycan-binding domain-containing protein [Acidobacteriota bacterium]MDW3229187.1 LysM peptidoglycan-binding domain-containing protein [Acidobacteriota bacterium]MDY0231089.1 LysM peptidoglycan-binding domain-containing protein [Candidatus Saccharicenans sp.]
MRYRFAIIIVCLMALVLTFFSCSSSSRKVQVNDQPASSQIKETSNQTGEDENRLSQTELSSNNSELTFAQIIDGISEPNNAETPAQAEEAYALIQEAQGALESGDLDEALVLLDQAYSVLLRIETSDDLSLDQEKNDLRILLAQKIQQVYAFRLPPPSTNHRTIPLVENKWVLSELKLFQTVERKFFEESYLRSGLYRPLIIEELKKAGLPEELSWLPLIESGFKSRALSRARALGLWQFIASTGYRYGLKRDRFIDERMDPIKSTQAAIKYLTELHDFFGDWTTAIAAYNCGEMRVQNVIRAQKIDYLDNFWDLFANLPYETARYVPRFIATLLIVENPEKYGFTLPQPEPALAFETININKPVKLSSLAARLGLNQDLLIQLNSELRHNSTPNYEYSLRVPPGYGEQTIACLNELPSWIPPEAVYGWHLVKKGENLGLIARRYRTTVSAIVRLNNLKNSRLIYPGQRLKIPGQNQDLIPADNDNQPVKVISGPAAGQEGSFIYVVKSGDTLYEISRTYGISINKIKKDNNLSSDKLMPGQELIINKLN